MVWTKKITKYLQSENTEIPLKKASMGTFGLGPHLKRREILGNFWQHDAAWRRAGAANKKLKFQPLQFFILSKQVFREKVKAATDHAEVCQRGQRVEDSGLEAARRVLFLLEVHVDELEDGERGQICEKRGAEESNLVAFDHDFFQVGPVPEQLVRKARHGLVEEVKNFQRGKR